MLTTNKSFLQATGFRVVINDEYRNLEFFAQSVQHPGATVNAVDVGIPKLTSMPLLGDKITYSELSLNLILDEDMASYKEMQSWLERTIDTTDGIESDITLVILTSHNNKNIQIRYNDCIPTTIGAIEFNSTSGDATLISFDATFRFSTFEII
jgi:hypothetical protein